MNNLELLILEVFDITLKKLTHIKLQQYEKAANLRDLERDLEVSIYEKLTGGSKYSSSSYVSVMNEYCMKEYGFGYKEPESLIQLKRHIKLKNLGI